MQQLKEKKKDLIIDLQDVAGELEEIKALNSSISDFTEFIQNKAQDDFTRDKAKNMSYFADMIRCKIGGIAIIIEDLIKSHASDNK